MYITGIKRSENMLITWDTFSVIPLMHPFYYLPTLLPSPAGKCTSNMTCNSYNINRHKYPVMFLDLRKIRYVLWRVRYICEASHQNPGLCRTLYQPFRNLPGLHL